MENLPTVDNRVVIDLTKDYDSVISLKPDTKYCKQPVQVCMRTDSLNCSCLRCVSANKIFEFFPVIDSDSDADLKAECDRICKELFGNAGNKSRNGEDFVEGPDDDSTYTDDTMPDDVSKLSEGSFCLEGWPGLTEDAIYDSKLEKAAVFEQVMLDCGSEGRSNPYYVCLSCIKTPGFCDECYRWMWRAHNEKTRLEKNNI